METENMKMLQKKKIECIASKQSISAAILKFNFSFLCKKFPSDWQG